jgi:hypothetical protein
MDVTHAQRILRSQRRRCCLGIAAVGRNCFLVRFKATS